MDREDARFVAHALRCRIDGARVELEQLAASSLMRLSAIAARIHQQNDRHWVPATVASNEIMALCRLGAKVADVELEEHRLEQLNKFLATIDKLIEEPVQPAGPRNRHERRAAARIQLPRSKRLIKAGAATIAELGLRR